ncbi:ABC transporter ATP-binding protein [Propionibacterium acidifaciens]|uniref:ABC transporter ATP-binding protein n=1 Tax=Propionibacterium acidifaciens TaxID=556499 RepID=UPI00361F40D2
MLRAENIRFAYRGGTPILRDVSLELAPGRVLGLLAPSGHGKSTLARILAGWERPDSGAVTLDGGPLGAHRPCRVQYLNQNPELAVNPRWRMERILTECWPVDERTRRALGIEPGWLGRFPGGLSGGELQRFCIARALHPRLRHLVADEMTTMLDPITQALIRSRLVGLIRERGIGLLVITHNPALAGRLCDDIIRLERINHLDPDESRP